MAPATVQVARRAAGLLLLALTVAVAVAVTVAARDHIDAPAAVHRQVQVSKHMNPVRGSNPRDEWSSIMGWLSIAFWVTVYSPQLWENYVLKSAEGLSVTFVIIWLLGDFFNMVGALWQGLLWTMIILAGYYVLCDIALIWQWWYYRKHYSHGVLINAAQQMSSEAEEGDVVADERTPLVRDEDGTSKPAGEQQPSNVLALELLKYAAALLLVATVGVLAWWLSRQKSNSVPKKPVDHGKVGWRWDAQISGWLSAVLYLSSRVPQIFKNTKTKCAGLSLALFIFAVLGNVTYVLSILIKSADRDYLIESASWLVGSGGTILLDFIVLGQFVYYRRERQAMLAQGE